MYFLLCLIIILNALTIFFITNVRITSGYKISFEIQNSVFWFLFKNTIFEILLVLLLSGISFLLLFFLRKIIHFTLVFPKITFPKIIILLSIFGLFSLLYFYICAFSLPSEGFLE